MESLTDAQMTNLVSSLVESHALQDADTWLLVNEDITRRFPSVVASGPGKTGLSVMLSRPDADVEERIRQRYGIATHFEYGTGSAW